MGGAQYTLADGGARAVRERHSGSSPSFLESEPCGNSALFDNAPKSRK